MKIDFISVPYDLGKYQVGMGKGPHSILDEGCAALAARGGNIVHERTVAGPENDSLTDLQKTFELNKLLSCEVRKTIEEGALPIVLAGNCITSIGTFAGMHDPRAGVVWMDAHGDFNTPETTQSGYLDGMALSILCGRCWKSLASSDQEFNPAAEDRVVLLGARDIDPLESEELHSSQVTLVIAEKGRRDAWELPEFDRRQVRNIYLHFDADVIDASVGHVSRFASSGGLFPKEIKELVSKLAKDFTVSAIGVTAYNPEYDAEGQARKELADIIVSMVEILSASKRAS